MRPTIVHRGPIDVVNMEDVTMHPAERRLRAAQWPAVKPAMTDRPTTTPGALAKSEAQMSPDYPGKLAEIELVTIIPRLDGRYRHNMECALVDLRALIARAERAEAALREIAVELGDDDCNETTDYGDFGINIANARRFASRALEAVMLDALKPAAEAARAALAAAERGSK